MNRTFFCENCEDYRQFNSIHAGWDQDGNRAIITSEQALCVVCNAALKGVNKR